MIYPGSPQMISPAIIHVMSRDGALDISGCYSYSAPIADNAWPSASQATFAPFRVRTPTRIYSVCIPNGTVVRGSFDAGVYDTSGKRLFSLGSTSQLGNNTMQYMSVNWSLQPGIYYQAMVGDNTTARYMYTTSLALTSTAALGLATMTSAFPLPVSATYTTLIVAKVPMVGFITSPVIGATAPAQPYDFNFPTPEADSAADGLPGEQFATSGG